MNDEFVDCPLCGVYGFPAAEADEERENIAWGETIIAAAQALLDQWDGKAAPMNPAELWEALRAVLPPAQKDEADGD